MKGDSIGVDIGGSLIKAVRRTGAGAVAARVSQPTPATAAGMLDEVAAIASRLGPGLPVGVGMAGLVDRGSGILVWGPHLRGSEIPIGPGLSDRLGVRVVVDNDVNFATVAEFAHGAGSGFDHGVCICIGTGIGLGSIVGGELMRGRGYAGEIGHMTVDAAGDECPCGRRGCLETKISGWALDRAAGHLLGPAAGAADLLAAARQGEPEATKAVAASAHAFAIGVETVVLLLDPELVILGGGIGTGAVDLLMPAIVERLAVTEGAPHRVPTPVLSSTLGPDAGAIGAAVEAISAQGAT